MSSSQKIHFFSLKKGFRVRDQSGIRVIISRVLKKEKTILESLNIIFCTDDQLLKINQDWLGHDFFTDIISFNLSPSGKPVNGEIYISIDRVLENAKSLKTTANQELKRVIIHGILHLSGYNDKTKAEKVKMRALEDQYLKIT